MGFFSNLGSALPNTFSALGNYFGAQAQIKANDKINQENILNSQAINAQSLADAQKNRDLEMQFAQNGIQWRVADAAKVGISPLAALGASEPGYSPVAAVMNAPQLNVPDAGATYRAWGQFGQDASRALMATQTPYQRTSEALDLVHRQRENDLIDTQVKQAQLNLSRSASPGIPSVPNAYVTMRNADGSLSNFPSADAAYAVHSLPAGGVTWQLENRLMPWIGEKIGQVAGESIRLQRDFSR